VARFFYERCNTGKARVCRKDDISNILFLTGASLPLNGTGTFTAFARERIHSLELVPSALLPDVRKQGLGVALANNGMPDPPFRKGLNNLRYREEVIARTKRAIDECVEFGVSNVIAFTGYKWTNAEDPQSGQTSREQGSVNCVAGLMYLAQYAGENGVTTCLEH